MLFSVSKITYYLKNQRTTVPTHTRSSNNINLITPCFLHTRVDTPSLPWSQPFTGLNFTCSNEIDPHHPSLITKQRLQLSHHINDETSNIPNTCVHLHIWPDKSRDTTEFNTKTMTLTILGNYLKNKPNRLQSMARTYPYRSNIKFLFKILDLSTIRKKVSSDIRPSMASLGVLNPSPMFFQNLFPPLPGLFPFAGFFELEHFQKSSD